MYSGRDPCWRNKVLKVLKGVHIFICEMVEVFGVAYTEIKKALCFAGGQHLNSMLLPSHKYIYIFCSDKEN